MSQEIRECPCKSGLKLDKCCLPFIASKQSDIKTEKSIAVPEPQTAPTPEKLMRSRYSAYVLQHYNYIVATYVSSKAKTLSIEAIKNESQNTQWLSLKIVQSSHSLQTGKVEFVAYYREKDKENGPFYCMHELSTFIKEDGFWKYEAGKMLAKTGKIKPERNKPCLCGSGKKFKHCCC